VAYHDPHVPELSAFGLRHTELEAGLDGADVAVIVTAHPSVDHDAVARTAPATVDFRGVTRHLEGAPVVRLGAPS
jgi:UDP-N-acetyl-D-glucosamine dehydrogenase